MKKIFIVMSLFLMILEIGGCQKRYAYAAYRERLGEWVGKNSETLYDHWGRPQTLEDLDANTIAVTYYQTGKQEEYRGFAPYMEQVKNADSKNVKNSVPLSYGCKVTFVIHNNLVLEYDFEGNNCY